MRLSKCPLKFLIFLILMVSVSPCFGWWWPWSTAISLEDGHHAAIAVISRLQTPDFPKNTIVGSTIVGTLDGKPLTANQLNALYKDGSISSNQGGYHPSKAENKFNNYDPSQQGKGVELRTRGPFERKGDFPLGSQTSYAPIGGPGLYKSLDWFIKKLSGQNPPPFEKVCTANPTWRAAAGAATQLGAQNAPALTGMAAEYLGSYFGMGSYAELFGLDG